MKEKQLDEYWYYFGCCRPYPCQIPKGRLPHRPYKRFNTKEACQKYINKQLKKQ